jgi:hypothetical protein
MKFILADNVRDVFKAALLESRPKTEREIRATAPRRSRPMRSSIHP